jgi:Secretory lipase
MMISWATLRSSAGAAFAALGVFAATAGAATAAPSLGPGGNAFYAPPSPLAPGRHGDVIWVRPLTTAAALPSAARNLLVLYHSTSVAGRDIAVSGTVAIPKGAPPAGGWPVISWAHGTTGLAADCAPSRDEANGPDHSYLVLSEKMLDTWVGRGYAVVQTDYEGLGAPGVHPYLIGVSEARGVVDMVRAARQAEPRIGTRYAISGHSQGGQGALFAAEIAQQWAPELTPVGDVALAPASHVLPYVQGLMKTSTPTLGFAFMPYFLVGVAAADPAVQIDRILTPAAVAKVPDAQRLCIDALRAPGSWGTLVPSDQFRSDADTTALFADLAANDPGALKILMPTLLGQGTADTVVGPIATDLLGKQLCDNGVPVSYRVYDGATHRGLLDASLADTEAWIDARFARSEATSNCGSLPHAARGNVPK